MENNKKWIYIIQRSGQITELQLTEDKFSALIQAWQDGDKIITKSMNGEPMGINSVDISNIFGDDGYQTYVDNLKQNANYIRKGIWYDRKERKKVRLEKWKEIEKIENEKIQSGEKTEITPEQQKMIRKKIDEVRKYLDINVFKKKE